MNGYFVVMGLQLEISYLQFLYLQQIELVTQSYMNKFKPIRLGHFTFKRKALQL